MSIADIEHALALEKITSAARVAELRRQLTEHQDALPRAEYPELTAIPMPTSCEVLVYPSNVHPGKWIMKVHAEAINVLNGEVEGFQERWVTDEKPTRRDVADCVARWLKHEVEEQLGLEPHGAVT